MEIFRTLKLKSTLVPKSSESSLHAGNFITNIYIYQFFISIVFQVWRINIDVPEEGKNASIDSGDGDRWWEQVDLKKLILASNQIKELSSEIKNLPALNVLDVCTLISPENSLNVKKFC